MGRLIGRIGNNGLCFRKCLRYLVVHLVKGNAVVDISGRYHRLKHETVLVAGRMGLICKLPLMAALYEQATVRVGHALGDDPCFSFFRLASSFLDVLSLHFSVDLEAHRRLQKASSLGLPGLR